VWRMYGTLSLCRRRGCQDETGRGAFFAVSDSVPVVEQARISPEHLNALRKVHERLHGSQVTWLVCAGMSLLLQGVPVSAHDIDLETDAAGAYEIERLFAEYVTRRVNFSSTDRIRSHFGALCIDGIKVEIIGDIEIRAEDGTWERSPDLQKHRRFVAVEGMQIPVLSLEYECEAYRKLGRPEKAELVCKWLEKGQPDGSAQ
jgi:hypothetical protein